MKNTFSRSILAHSLMLVSCLAAAYLVWTREPDTATEDETPMLRWRSAPEQVVYSDKEGNVRIEKHHSEKGGYYWIRTEKWEDPLPPPGTTASQPTSRPTQKTLTVKEFKGSSATEEMMQRLAAFPVLRNLGQLEGGKEKAFELTGSKDLLTLKSAAGERKFVIGGKTYGNADYYVQDQQDKRVFVVSPKLVQDVKYAEFRLFERNLFTAEMAEVDGLSIQALGKTKLLAHQNRRDPEGDYWSDETTPANKNTTYKDWVGKLTRLHIMEYAPLALTKATLQEVIKIEFRYGTKVLDRITILKGKSLKPDIGADLTANPQAPEAVGYYAQSDATTVPVLLTRSLVEDLLKDLPAVLK